MEHFSWWQSAIFPCINFLIFLGALIYFARAPLRKMAQQRSQDYAALLSKSLELQEKASQQLKELNQRLSGLDKELATLRARLNDEASSEADKIREKGLSLKSYILEEAERIRTAEVTKAEVHLQELIIRVMQENFVKEVKEKWQDTEQLAFVKRQTKELQHIDA